MRTGKLNIDVSNSLEQMEVNKSKTQRERDGGDEGANKGNKERTGEGDRVWECVVRE